MTLYQATLSRIFGFESFRPGQAEIVEAVVAGRECLAIMPTGGGKSLCFQLPALERDGVTLVISPLIALMRDQVRALQALGVAAGALNSNNSEVENSEVFEALGAGRLKLLYMAPERLSSGGTMRLLRQAGVSLIAVDEAHCVSQWGHDFRPDYLEIGKVRAALNVPLAAFTATADQQTRNEIVARLFDGHAPEIFLHGFDRPNLHLAFAPKSNPRRQILDFANARRGQSGIVYCATRAKTETLARALGEAGHSACAYHGGMEAEARRDVETRFSREDGLIVAATVAFGMGVDKPDVRWVAHADLPKSIESYYQEIGRAGRDGAPAETLTLYGSDDIRLRRGQIDESPAPCERKSADHGRLNALLGLAEAQSCRREILLGYFGEDHKKCGACDLCETLPDLFDGTEQVRMALSAALRSGQSFGMGHLIDILIGNETEKIRQRGHANLPTFGVGKSWSRAEWQAIFRQMMGLDLLRPDSARYGALVMTEIARPVLRGEEAVMLRRDTISRGAKPAARALVSEEDAPLLAALKAKRRQLAEAARVPAYVVFTDRTLIELAEQRPTDIDQMMSINGIGQKKLDKYGDAFLEVIRGDVSETVHPARRKLAGREAGSVYDRLLAAQAELQHGVAGTEKPLSCSSGLLAKVAQLGSADPSRLLALLGEKRAERFGARFLEILGEAA